MTTPDVFQSLIDENDGLRDQIGALERRNVVLEALVERMAAELDARAANHANPAQETREWVGEVSWRGSVASYEQNSLEINRQLAQMIHKMSMDAANVHFGPKYTPEQLESLQKGAQNALQKGSPSIEAHGREDAPEGLPDPQGGPPREAEADLERGVSRDAADSRPGGLP